MRWRSGLVVLTLLGIVLDPAGAGAAGDLVPPADPFCAALSGACLRPPYVTVLSAFPAELQPLLAATDVAETIATGERTYHIGRLGGARVLLVRCGIGLVNAATTARGVLDRFRVSRMIFSGVAGSGLDIGDVAVPATWTDHMESFPVNGKLLAVARTLTVPPVPLEQCTLVPPDQIPPNPPGRTVCLDHLPRIVAGGGGESSDPFNGTVFKCIPGGGPVFGCDEFFLAGASAIAPAAVLDATDMETAAVARVARDAAVPFIAFRGVSDGNGDPLGLPGFPAQFFAYYRISADNAAATTIAFLEAWSARHSGRAGRPRARRTTSRPPRIGAACDWPRAVGRVCAGERAPGAVTRRVAEACGFLAEAADAGVGSAAAQAAEREARTSWARAARLLKSGANGQPASRCRRALGAALEARSAAPAGAGG